jgi:hypothetical protein
MNTSLRHISWRTWLVAVGAAVAVSATLATGSAHGSTPEGITSSSVTVSQSMVPGSSTTSLGSSPLAAAVTGKAADNTGRTTSYEVMTTYDPATEKVLARKRFGPKTEGKIIHPPAPRSKDSGTGGTSTASGCVRVEIWQKRTTLLGAFAAKWGVWTDWCWNRATQVVSINAKGRDFDVAPCYSFDGVTDQDAYFYDFSTDDGHPRSAYHHHKKGGFSSPASGVLPGGHWYPKNTLDSYYNGTNQWFTSD